VSKGPGPGQAMEGGKPAGLTEKINAIKQRYEQATRSLASS